MNKSELYDLLPPNYNNKLLKLNNLKLTYILNKTTIKEKMKIIFNYYNIKIIKKNSKLFKILNQLFNNFYDIDKYFTLNLFTFNLNKKTKIIFKFYKNKNIILIFHNNSTLDKLFINTLY